MWTVKASDGFQAWFRIQDADTRAAIAAAVRFLEVDGPQLGRPRADTLNGSKLANLKELRVSKGSEPVRCAYIFDPKRQAVLLCGGSKQGKSGKSEEQFYKNLIKVAEAEYSKYLQQLQEEENDRD